LHVLIVSWEAGGTVQPALGLARTLVARGHDVRVLGPESLRVRVAWAGGRFRPWPATLDFDPSRGRAFEDQWDHVWHETLLGSGVPAAVRAEIAAERPDVVVVDYMLRSAWFEVERAGVPAVPLLHMTHRHHRVPPDEDPDAEWGVHWQYREVNAVRADMGLAELPLASRLPSVVLAEQAPLAIVVMPREFDDWPEPPASVVHVGPIFEEDAAGPERPGWDSPWAPNDRRPLIVVSLGSTYMHHEALLGRIAKALAGIDARVLLLTGNGLAPDELEDVPDTVVVRRYVPHMAVLGDAALLVTHGGMGSLMAAFAAGVPTVCIPLGRDQVENAERAEELGTSITLSPEVEPAVITATVERALTAPDMRAAAERMREIVSGYGGGVAAAERLERLVVEGSAMASATA
jgi:MGT family glycosyltransferase